jgi:hypothetical protein
VPKHSAASRICRRGTAGLSPRMRPPPRAPRFRAGRISAASTRCDRVHG